MNRHKESDASSALPPTPADLRPKETDGSGLFAEFEMRRRRRPPSRVLTSEAPGPDRHPGAEVASAVTAHFLSTVIPVASGPGYPLQVYVRQFRTTVSSFTNAHGSGSHT